MDVLNRAGMTFADIDDVILVGGTTKIPAVKSFVEELTGKSPLCYIDPHEVVAMGAAVASAEGTDVQLDKRPSVSSASSLEISDVVSHSFGIHAVRDDRLNYVSKIIEKNEKLPIQRSRPFSNLCDYDPELMIEVYEGESETTIEANCLGKFFIEVVPRPAFTNKIEVSLEIGTEYGILDVTAKDLETGIQRKVRMEAKSRLTNKEKQKWAKKLSGGTLLTVVVQDETRKMETSLFLDPNRSVCDVLQRLQQRSFIPATEQNQYLLYSKGQSLQGSELLADLADGKEICLSLRSTGDVGRVGAMQK
jgi:molecular chaperone DnaK